MPQPIYQHWKTGVEAGHSSRGGVSSGVHKAAHTGPTALEAVLARQGTNMGFVVRDGCSSCVGAIRGVTSVGGRRTDRMCGADLGAIGNQQDDKGEG